MVMPPATRCCGVSPSLMRAGLRKTDQAGRLGGEEFAILLVGADCTGALEFAERLREQVEADEIVFDDRKLRITVSIGVTRLCESDASVDTALARADAALYQAKAKGRNRVESA
jgi:diguanylate cyclase (GGDEF)-like protein